MTKPTTIFPLKIEQGATFSKLWLFENSDGSPWDMSVISAARCQFRQNPDITSPVIADVDLLDGGIVIDTVAGSLALNLTDAQTYLFNHNKCSYDILLTLGTGPGALVWKFAKGDVQVVASTTYPPA